VRTEILTQLRCPGGGPRRTNFSRMTAVLYEQSWRARSLTLMTGEPSCKPALRYLQGTSDSTLLIDVSASRCWSGSRVKLVGVNGRVTVSRSWRSSTTVLS